MQEILPLAIGVLIGLVVQRISKHSLKVIVLVILCLFFGALVSYINGELAIHWSFISIDALLVWTGALLASVLNVLWHRFASLR